MRTHHDLYCERMEPGLWAEPLNAVTNIAFFIAAFFAWQIAKRENALDWQTWLLIALIAIIGTGSTLFHTFATTWALLADSLPILFYQIAFLNIYGRRVIGLRCTYNSLLMAGFLTSVATFGALPQDWLNGSLGYAPAILFLLGLGVYHRMAGKNHPNLLLIAAGVFLVSLTFRSIDMAVCDYLSIGVHYFWHILNGLVLYLTMKALATNAR